MISIQIFKQIKEKQKEGKTQAVIAEELSIGRSTVVKWWRKSESEFQESLAGLARGQLVLESYKAFILDLIKLTPQIKVTNILYKLKAEDPNFNPEPRALYRFVKKLREEAGLLEFTKRLTSIRARTEPGEEAQVDFGQMKLKTMYDTRIKVYFFSMVLSYSNYRFVYFSPKPFTTKEAIKAHTYGFRYYGGRPKRILYDLDGVFAYSENYGDIIIAKDFEEYARKLGYSIVFCSARDPQSKGKVENLVKFVKQSLLEGHIYTGVDALNAAALAWLDTTGNNNLCGSLRFSPRDLFREEQASLEKVNWQDTKEEQKVFHITGQNSVAYKGNHYELPRGTNLILSSVEIDILGDTISFFNPDTHDFLCSYTLSPPKKNAILTLKKADIAAATIEKLEAHFFKSEKFAPFMARLKEQMGRYFVKQSGGILSATKVYKDSEFEEAFSHCIKIDKCNLTELLAFLIYKHGKEKAKKILSKEKRFRYFNRAAELEVQYNG